MRDVFNEAINQGIDCVKAYTPYLRQNEYDRYAKAILKEDAIHEYNDLLTLAIGQDNLGNEKTEIFSVIKACFSEIEEFT